MNVETMQKTNIGDAVRRFCILSDHSAAVEKVFSKLGGDGLGLLGVGKI